MNMKREFTNLSLDLNSFKLTSLLTIGHSGGKLEYVKTSPAMWQMKPKRPATKPIQKLRLRWLVRRPIRMLIGI
ncbi:MAG: hypothetical protein QXD12_00865 [Candidatus Nezhaarchaeales archaeon]